MEDSSWEENKKKKCTADRAFEKLTLSKWKILSKIEFQMQYGMLACTFRQTVIIAGTATPSRPSGATEWHERGVKQYVFGHTARQCHLVKGREGR